MLQGADPFDEFRMKQEIARLEGDFRENAERKRRRLKELLDGDDGGDPGGIALRVQEEMESFFRESATAAESVFSEVADEGEAASQEIFERLEEVLRPVEPDPDPEPGPRPEKEPEGVEQALARLRGEESAPAPDSVEGDMPDWLDVTEETIDGDGEDGPSEDPDRRRQRILGAFDEGASRFRDLIRKGLAEAQAAQDAEAAQEAETADASVATAVERRVEPEPPLERRSESGRIRPLPGDAAEPGREGSPISLQARLEVLEQEVARLRRALERQGLLATGNA